jgi:hypothetical protein
MGLELRTPPAEPFLPEFRDGIFSRLNGDSKPIADQIDGPIMTDRRLSS